MGKLGLRGRLLAAIGSIALLAVCAAGIAVLAFRMTQHQQQIVSDQAIPALITGQQLYTKTGRLNNIARAVASATNSKAIGAATANLDQVEQTINGDITRLGGLGVENDILEDFSSKTGMLSQDIRDLQKVRNTLFETRARQNDLLDKIVGAANDIEQGARQQNTSANMQLSNSASALYSLVGDPAKVDDAYDTLDKLLDEDAVNAQHMSDLRATAFQIPGLVERAVSASDSDTLDKVKFRVDPLLTQLEQGVNHMPNPDLQKDAKDKLEIISKGLAPKNAGNLFDLRKSELEIIQKIDRILSENATISQQIAQTAEQLLGRMNDKIDEANGSVGTTIQGAQTIMVAVALAAIVISGLIMWLYVQRNLLRRLIGLNGAMKRLTGGDLDTPVTDRGRDEIADMAKAVETFRENAREADRLRAENRATEERAEQNRRQALLEMADGFESSVNAMVGELLRAVGDMRDTADHMASNASDNVNRAVEVSNASQNASQNVSSVSSATEELSASIREIERQVAKAEEISQSAVAEAKQSDETVRQMSETASRIGEVIALITEIADQTNLLALNATIESARAGDAGKGFAVVAGEVKNLAAQTQRATEDIGKQIDEMRSVSDRAVEMISSITRTIGEMDSISTSIGAAMRQQGAATGEIANGSEEAANGVRHVSTNMESVSQSAETVRDLSTRASSVAEELLQRAQNLQDEANSFVARVRAG